MADSLARANPLLGLTEKEYEDFACALVGYVALHATADQTAYFVNLCRDYAPEIAGKAGAAEWTGLPKTVKKRTFKNPVSH